jgi:hypothetical protein
MRVTFWDKRHNNSLRGSATRDGKAALVHARREAARNRAEAPHLVFAGEYARDTGFAAPTCRLALLEETPWNTPTPFQH